MALETAWRVGIGVALGWAALPWLVMLARRSRSALPCLYYRALVAALGIATALIFLPLLRGLLGSPVALRALGTGSAAEPSTVTFVTELVRPLLGAAENAWPTLPLAQTFAAVGGLWLLLLAAGMVSSIAGRLRLHREYGQAPSAPERVLRHAARVAAELNIRPPAIRVADAAAAFTYGALSPLVILGTSSCELQDEDLDFVLRHELCHIVRHDTRTMYLIDFAQRCFAGHPSLRWLAAEIRVAREARADRAAAGDRPLEYARFLLTIAERIHSRRAPLASLVSMADTALERRVEMLVEPNPNRSRLRRSMPWLLLAGLALGSLVFLTPASWGQPDRAASDRPTVKGNLSIEQVEKGLFANPAYLLSCYGTLSAPRTNLSAHVSFEIDERGRVSSGRVSVPELPELEPCLREGLMKLTFEPPSSGQVSVEASTLLTPPYDERRAVLETKEGVSQRLPKEVIRTAVRSYLPQLRDCFEQLEPARSAAKVSMNFTIARDGQVSDGQAIDEASEGKNQLTQCVDRVMRSMRFPAPEDGIVSVSYPLEFENTPSPAD
jgi:beta-lactamase regulating signal transducer with metallopeptidase domain